MLRKTIISLVLMAILIGIGLFGYSQFSGMKEEAKEALKVEQINHVTTRVATYGTEQASIQSYGKIEGSHPIQLAAEAQGRILAGDVPMKVGQKFQKGAVLFRVDNTEARLALQAKKSAFANRIAIILPDLKLDYTESYDVWFSYFNDFRVDRNVPKLPAFPTNKEKIFLSRSGIVSEYYSLLADEERLRKYTVYAPYYGVYSQILAQVGDLASPGMRIGVLNKSTKLELAVPVAQEDIQLVKIGAKVKVFDTKTEAKWTGKVIRKADQIDPMTQSLLVYIQMPNNEKSLFEGMYLKAQIAAKEIDDVISIDRSFLVDQTYVYLKKNGQLKKQAIEIVFKNEANVYIKGVTVNDSIIVQQLAGAYENMKLADIH